MKQRIKDSLTVDQPKLAASLRRRLSRRIRLNTAPRTHGRMLASVVWPLIAEAYSAGYRAGDEDQMQMRIRDTLERSGDQESDA